MTPMDSAPSSFDAALLDVSDLLADARTMERHGSVRAAALYAAAERRALAAGYLELLHLVWAYTPPTSVAR